MRVTNVKKARKDQGRCGKCGTEIVAGDSYRWIKFRFGGKRIRCSADDCRFRASDMTTSDKVSNIWLAQEQIEDRVSELRDSLPDVASEQWPTWLEELADLISESVSLLQETGEEYEESASNMEEYFSGSSQVDEINDKADHCREMADELEQTEGSVRDVASNDPSDLSWNDVESLLDEVDNAICDIQPY